MNKVVDWGHWVVGTFFLLLGADILLSSTMHVPGLVREHPQQVLYFVLGHAFLVWLPAFFCAWGVFKWRAWARKLGIGLCVFFVVAAVALVLYFRHIGRLDTPLLVMGLVTCAALVWLILPSVGAEYSRRNRVA